MIALRRPAGATHPVQMIYSDPTCTEFADTPALQGSPYFRAVLAAFACPLHAVRLMRLTPGGSRCTMPVGSVWYLRLSDPHSVANRGAEDRVHLVIDAVVNGWVEALFQQAEVQAA